MSAAPAPQLFLLVDAVPFALAREAWSAGGLPGFAPPRPLVSVFPSLTNVAVPALLRGIFEERPRGYEARYLDPHTGEVHGGFRDPASESAMAPFRARPDGFFAHVVVYVLPQTLSYSQIRWISHRFEREGGPWLGYLSATDGVGHFGGRTGLARALRDIGGRLDALRREHRQRHGTLPGVVLCSDHGMAFGRFEHLAAAELAERLACAGFQPGGRGRDAVTLVPFGDVGGGAVYADPERATEVARIVAEAPGVDLAFGRVEGGCLAFGGPAGQQRARLAWRGDRYRYVAESGDPLAYLPVWAELERSGRLHAGWADDRELFLASWNERYPDALARVRCGLEDLVQTPAAVLFSMQDGCTFGPALAHAGARLMGGQAGTHGSLSSAQSLGFACCSEETGDPWPGAPALRPEQVFAPWRELVRSGSATG